MGVSYYAELAFGVKLDKFPKRKDEMVTKYNEDTGEPYQKLVSVYEQTLRLPETGFTFQENDQFPDVHNITLMGYDNVYGLGFILISEDPNHEALIPLTAEMQDVEALRQRFIGEVEPFYGPDIVEKIYPYAQLMLFAHAG